MAKLDDLLLELDTALRNQAAASSAATQAELLVTNAVAAVKAELTRTPVLADVSALLDRIAVAAAKTA